MEIVTIKDCIFIIITAAAAWISYRRGERAGWLEGQTDILTHLQQLRIVSIEEDALGNIHLKKGDDA